jgi:Zn-dependent peptidase ImmA (M78 family)
MSRSLNAQAFASGRDIYFNTDQFNPKTAVGKGVLAHELAHVIQHDRASKVFGTQTDKGAANHPHHFISKLSGWPAIPVGRLLRQAEPKLLRDFAKKFPGAANLVRKSPEAMKLMKTATAKGVVFGGYPLKRHGITSRAHTVGNKVYIPKGRTDKFLAMSDFVFEVNIAMRKKRSDTIKKLASQRRITAKQYAYRIVRLEIEAMLNTGLVWFKMRKKGYKGRKWSKYDKDFYLSSYKAFKTGKKTKNQLIKDALKRTYKTGIFAGWTVERYYMAQY